MKRIVSAMCVCATAGVPIAPAQPPPPRTPTSTSYKAAKNLSTVRAWSTDRVNVSENIPQQECRFAINGSPGAGAAGAMTALGRSGAGGLPPTPGLGQPGAANPASELAVQRAWESILRPNWSDASPFPVSDLALVLESTGAANPNPVVLRSLIEQNVAPLRNCFSARVQGQTFTFSSGAMVCVSSREPFEGVLRVGDSLGVEFMTSAPHMRLALRAGPLAHYMFLPVAPR